MAYWLSNTSTLLFLLQKSLKPAGAAAATPVKPTSLFGRMAMVFMFIAYSPLPPIIEYSCSFFIYLICDAM